MEYDELLSLCKDVIPSTWNVYKYCETDNCKMEKGILNIELDVYYRPHNQKNRKIKSQGHTAPIRYWDGVAHTKIDIYTYRIMWSDVLLHELAHVAVCRLESFIVKSYYAKLYYNDGREIETDIHGKLFNDFLSIIEKRAIKKGWRFFEQKSVKIWQKANKEANHGKDQQAN